jgi:hypothetical protein
MFATENTELTEFNQVLAAKNVKGKKLIKFAGKNSTDSIKTDICVFCVIRG